VTPVVAVGGLICDDDGRVLLIRRSRDPGKGMLGVPGGFVDVGETAEEAVRRETQEEVGLDLSEWTYLTSHPNRYVYQGVARPVLDLFFTARAVSLQPLAALDGVAEVLFLAPVDICLADVAFESIRRALRVWAGQSAAA